MIKTAATLFSGGEGVGVGLRMAGINHAWGIEYDDAIAQVARNNGFHVVTADVRECDPSNFADVDWLHASPPCINASIANNSAEVNEDGTKETPQDIELAEAVIRFIEAKQPQIFTLENVYFYRKFKSFKKIIKVLHDLGYAFKYWHVCMADYGVPQTRNRLILIARRDGVRPSLPPTTHAQSPKQTLFGSLQKWVGWYASIEDLIPTLPDSEFAPWQLARLPEEIKESFLPHIQVNSGTDGRWAFIVNDGDSKQPVIEEERPFGTVKTLASGGAMSRAFITDSKNAGQEWGNHYRDVDEPINSITAVQRPAHMHRAFIVPGGNASSFSVREEDEPCRVVGDTERAGNISRAFVVDGKLSSSNGEKILQINMEDEPHGTVVASPSPLRDGPAVAQGRVVQMTPRVLARFQAFPDWYVLPVETNKKTVTRQLKRYFVSGAKPSVIDGWALEYIETDMDLACKVIGNAVPPLFMQRLAETFIPQRP